jgi:HAD superfamily hydrolase (TIGR01509 family)
MTATAGVVFDVDGTLVDTNFLHTVCWSEALRQKGHDVPSSIIHRAMGMAGDLLLDHLLGSGRDHADDDEMTSSHLALYRQYWGRLRPLPGAADLLRGCADLDLRVVLATSASDEELDALRSALGADDVIEFATTSEDADTGKPAPDIVQEALRRAELDPDQAVLVGDSVWDGRAAHHAGVAFIGLGCGGTSEGELRSAHAREIWSDPRALLMNLGRSVIGQLGRPR